MEKITFMYLMLCAGAALAIISLCLYLRRLVRGGKGRTAIVLTSVLLVACICGGGLLLRDLPHLFTGELETAAGRVVSHDSGGREDVSDTRGITIETASGEQISLLTTDTPIHMDEYLEIAYLPNTHIGCIVESNAE